MRYKTCNRRWDSRLLQWSFVVLDSAYDISIVVETQWEMKERKITDFLSGQCRSHCCHQGGDNAGHTIVIDGKSLVALIPSCTSSRKDFCHWEWGCDQLLNHWSKSLSSWRSVWQQTSFSDRLCHPPYRIGPSPKKSQKGEWNDHQRDWTSLHVIRDSECHRLAERLRINLKKESNNLPNPMKQRLFFLLTISFEEYFRNMVNKSNNIKIDTSVIFERCLISCARALEEPACYVGDLTGEPIHL